MAVKNQPPRTQQEEEECEMGRNISCYFLAAIILLGTLLVGCGPAFWIQKYGDMPDVNAQPAWDFKQRRTIAEKNANIDKYYREHYRDQKIVKFKAEPIIVDPGKFADRREADVVITPNPDLSGGGTKLTFFHLSDVQLRDEQVRLYDKQTSELADHVITSFERSARQEVFDGAMYYAMVQAMNATIDSMAGNDPGKPAFMIHTGDAVDAGVVTELYEFLAISNEVKMPWYNVLGNHDSGVFGNIEQDMIFVNNPFVDFMALHSKFNIINMHHTAYEDDNFHFVYFSPNNTVSDYTLRASDRFYSKFNGFDRKQYSPDEIRTLQICWKCPGYYSIEVKGEDTAAKDPAIQMIVLDTGFRFGASGKLEDDQLKWLKEELVRSKNKVILVFGHHDIASITNSGELKQLLTASPNAVAYLCGHTHKPRINYHPGQEGRFGFWEIVAGALIEYPQQGSLVRVKYENGFGIIEVYAFDSTLLRTYPDKDRGEKSSELYEQVQLSRQGAKDDIPEWKRQQIDAAAADRYARLKFPYPKLH
jgi:3',5'-cyclic AMP phosphodiesterase CpdA